jgi:serine/threonine-protein kinase
MYVNPQGDVFRRITDEARLLIDLDHPALVHGFEILVPTAPEESVAIIMENVSSGSLASRIQKKGLDPTSMCCAIISIVMGMGALHVRGILHGRLKPSNVLFTCKGLAKISDFGSARGMLEERVHALSYSSPELLEGEAASEKSDVWALGLLLYELIALQAAFDPSLGIARLIRLVNSSERPAIPSTAAPESVRVIRSFLKSPKPRLGAVFWRRNGRFSTPQGAGRTACGDHL